MNSSIEAARTQMVNQQVRAWDVLDPVVLGTLSDVRREQFVPAQFRNLAFADTGVPLPCGQVMMSPQVEGRLLQALTITPADAVLEVGTGSGFLTACLARLGAGVVSLEIFGELAEAARAQLAGAGNATVLTEDVFRYAPSKVFDVIAVTGSMPVYDPYFEEWLAVGGRLFVITGERPVMEATLVRRLGPNEWSRESLFETVIPPLVNAVQPDKFVF